MNCSSGVSGDALSVAIIFSISVISAAISLVAAEFGPNCLSITTACLDRCALAISSQFATLFACAICFSFWFAIIGIDCSTLNFIICQARISLIIASSAAWHIYFSFNASSPGGATSVARAWRIAAGGHFC